MIGIQFEIIDGVSEDSDIVEEQLDIGKDIVVTVENLERPETDLTLDVVASELLSTGVGESSVLLSVSVDSMEETVVGMLLETTLVDTEDGVLEVMGEE